MKFLGVAALLLVALAGFVGAGDPEPATELDPAEAVRQFRRDRKLIESLVESGLRLAGEEDPLKRADQCNVLAEQLSQEIQQAAADREGQRAEALGNHLNALLVRGVAGNLTLALGSQEPDAPPAPEMKRIAEQAALALKPAEEELGRPAHDGQASLQQALKFVHGGRAAVEKALKAHGHPKAKGKRPPPSPPAGKKAGVPRK
jgi:hypothetical protein